jgi:predicted ABC-type ATPase
MNYIGIESPDIAKERVRIRVTKGGHGVSEDIIEKRYHESLKNLKTVIDICDELNIYDNTNKFEQIAYIVNGELRWKSTVLPNWAKEIFNNRIV